LPWEATAISAIPEQRSPGQQLHRRKHRETLQDVPTVASGEAFASHHLKATQPKKQTLRAVQRTVRPSNSLSEQISQFHSGFI
jgi:hypothetical protein